MSSSFPSRIRHTQVGDPVAASVASAAAKTLEARTNYLKELLDTINAGRALIQQNVLVSASALEGQPVYWDADNQLYAPAKAGVENDPVISSLVPTAASDVTGVILTKKANNLADIVLWGLVKFADLSNAIEDAPIVPGRYYLSAQEAGKLVLQRPAVTVSVCVVYGPLDACDEDTWVFVMPQMRDFLEDHIHYSYDLTALPAGDVTPPISGERHVITNPDAAKPGWLPADHASFNGKAPAGASFGYNLAMHPALERNWPPIPLTSCLLELHTKGVASHTLGMHQDFSYNFGTIAADDFQETTIAVAGANTHDVVVVAGKGSLPDDVVLQAYVPTPGQVTVRATNPTPAGISPGLQDYHVHVMAAPPTPDNTVVGPVQHIDTLSRMNSNSIQFTAFGIWWMTDCYDKAPWSAALNTLLSSSSSSSVSAPSSLSSLSSEASAVPVCNLDEEQMWLTLSFVKMTFATDQTTVTSLQPDTDQPLKYVDCDGNEASTGDLRAQLLLALLIDSAEYIGGATLKGITTDNKFKRGYVTEGIIAGSSKVSLSSTHSRYLTPGDESTPEVHQEIVTLDVTVDPTDRELMPQIEVLGDALERLYQNIPYIGFPSNRDAGIRIKFVVPPEGLPDSPTLKIRVVIFGRGNGTMTDMDTSYYRFARPTAGVPTPVAGGDTAMVLDTAVVVTTDNAVEIESAPFAVAAGDTVLVSIDRAAAGTPTYEFEMGIIRVGAIIEGS